MAWRHSFNLNGYRMVANEGGIFDFGLDFNGSLANNHLNAPIVGIANSPGPNGYLMAGGDGGVFALGGANFFGSLGGQAIPSPIAAIAATPSEDGYWLASSPGRSTTSATRPPCRRSCCRPGPTSWAWPRPTPARASGWSTTSATSTPTATPSTRAASGACTINAPIVGIAAAANGQGYILVASDGGTFNYGVPFHGSVPGSLMPGQHLVAPIVGIAVTHSGNGYWEVGADGGVFNYGDAPFLGSIYTAMPSGHAQRADRRDPAPGLGAGLSARVGPDSPRGEPGPAPDPSRVGAAAGRGRSVRSRVGGVSGEMDASMLGARAVTS